MNTNLRLQTIRQFILALIVLVTLALAFVFAPQVTENIATPDTDSPMLIADHGASGGGG